MIETFVIIGSLYKIKNKTKKNCIASPHLQKVR